MSGIKQLYAFFTVAGPELDSFLSQITQKLGGKKFNSNGKALCVFAKPHRACHGALYYLKKCQDTELADIKVVVLKGTQASLIKDSQHLFALAQDLQCLVTDEVIKELNDADTEHEILQDVTLPSSTQSTHTYRLTKFNDIIMETSDEELFDYSNVVAPPAVSHIQEEAPDRVNILEGNLEISETNQIYDYQQEQILKKQESEQEGDEPEEKAHVPSYAAAQMAETEGVKESPGLPSVADLGEEKFSKANITIPTIEFEQPAPGIKGIWEDKKLLFTLVGGFISMGLIFYFALGGGNPFSNSEEYASNDEYGYEDCAEFDDCPEDKPIETPKPKNIQEEPVKPKKRVFTPILTEDESKKAKQSTPEQTLFPQTVGSDTAYLEIKSTPPGASIYINGAKLKGETPMKTFLVYANQKLNIKISKPGYDNVQKTETIPPGQRRGFMFELVPSN